MKRIGLGVGGLVFTIVCAACGTEDGSKMSSDPEVGEKANGGAPGTAQPSDPSKPGPGVQAGGGAATGPNGPTPAEINLTDLKSLTAHSVLLYEGEGTLYGVGALQWVNAQGEKITVSETWDAWDRPTISPDRKRVFFFRGNGKGSGGVPRLMHVTDSGYTPVRQLDGNVAFSNGIASEDWSLDSRFIVGWGGIEGEFEESVGIYDTTLETLVGSMPVTDSGGLGSIIGGTVLYRYDRETEKPALVSIQGDSLSSPMLIEEMQRYYPAPDGAVWRIGPESGLIERSPQFGGEFEALSNTLKPKSLILQRDGSGAFAAVEGTLFLAKVGAEPKELLSGVKGTGVYLAGEGLAVTLEDDSKVYVDEKGSVPIDSALSWTPINHVRQSHLLDDKSGVIGGGKAGQFGIVQITPPDAGRVSCAYAQDYGPLNKLAVPYVMGDSSHLVLVDISQPLARVVRTLDAAPGTTFGCPKFSIDGNSLVVAQTGDTGSTVYTIDWTTEPGEPTVTLESAETVDVFTML